MTTVTNRVRGALIGFSATFTDETGAAYTPPSATLKVAYRVSGVSTTATVAMSFTGATAKATWDSSVADADRVYWFINTGGASKAADEGEFQLVANPANT